MAKNYFEKFALRPPILPTPPAKDLKIAIVIPVYNEPDVTTSVESILNCSPIDFTYEIILVVNQSKDDTESLPQNRTSISEIKKLQKKHTHIHLIEELYLAPKIAGVGTARKIGMDEAARRLPDNGVIVCFDADSTVSSNYLSEIYRHFFVLYPSANGASIHFEHPLNGKNQHKIQVYELYLQYQILSQRFAGLPYAFHTVGSSMACRNKTYQAVGGMNKRKAGEDFYFLHKVIAQQHFYEINTCCVYPSNRNSTRVPFGTGRAMLELKNGEELQIEPFEVFEELKILVQQLPSVFKGEKINLSNTLSQFLEKEGFTDAMKKIKSVSSSEAYFIRHFFTWFSAFRNMKFGHFYAHKHGWSTLEKELPKLNTNYRDLSLPNILKSIRENAQFKGKVVI